MAGLEGVCVGGRGSLKDPSLRLKQDHHTGGASACRGHERDRNYEVRVETRIIARVMFKARVTARVSTNT